MTADSVYTKQEVDLILFLEWLDSEGHVAKFRDGYVSHEDVARAYIAERAEFDAESVQMCEAQECRQEATGEGLCTQHRRYTRERDVNPPLPRAHLCHRVHEPGHSEDRCPCCGADRLLRAIADTLETVTAERDALRASIEDGPHQEWCGDVVDAGPVDSRGCNCWVSRALDVEASDA